MQYQESKGISTGTSGDCNASSLKLLRTVGNEKRRMRNAEWLGNGKRDLSFTEKKNIDWPWRLTLAFFYHCAGKHRPHPWPVHFTWLHCPVQFFATGAFAVYINRSRSGRSQLIDHRKSDWSQSRKVEFSESSCCRKSALRPLNARTRAKQAVDSKSHLERQEGWDEFWILNFQFSTRTWTILSHSPIEYWPNDSNTQIQFQSTIWLDFGLKSYLE